MAFHFLACTLEAADKFKNGPKFRPGEGYGICFKIYAENKSPDMTMERVRGILYQTGFRFYPGLPNRGGHILFFLAGCCCRWLLRVCIGQGGDF